VTSRLLQSLLSPPPRTTTSFLFITRHPLAVSLAHRRWPSNARQSLSSLVLHWVASHRTLAVDLPHLRAARVLRFEDLAGEPTACYEQIVRWLHLSQPPVLRAHQVQRDTNSKYERSYCMQHLQTLELQREHCSMAAALQPPISELGLEYDVRRGGEHGFQCIAGQLSPDACEDVSAPADLVRDVRAHELQLLRDAAAHEAGQHLRVSLGGAELLCGALQPARDPKPARFDRGAVGERAKRGFKGRVELRSS